MSRPRTISAMVAVLAVVAIAAGCSSGGGSSKAHSSQNSDSSSATHKSTKKHAASPDTGSSDSGSTDTGASTSQAASTTSAASDMGNLNYTPPAGFTKDASKSTPNKVVYSNPTDGVIEIDGLTLDGQTADQACTTLATTGGGANATPPKALTGIPGDTVVGCQDDFTSPGGNQLHQGIIVIVHGSHAWYSSLVAFPSNYNDLSDQWVDSLTHATFS